jgi:hypothetical protein
MQDLWSRVLAGEANSPGSYSRRTVNFLADLDKWDAELFASLCSFNWKINESNEQGMDTSPSVRPIVFYAEDNEVYTSRGLRFDTLAHLESIGLIQFDSLRGYKIGGLP